MDTQRLIDIFLQVIRINALSGQEKPVADFISAFLAEYQYAVLEDDSKPYTESNTGNLICKVGSGGEFMLLSHMDTARETKDTKPVIKEDRIVSSGDTVLGVDNRVGISVLLFLLERIAKEKIPVRDFTVAFTTCEETTLFGSKHLNVSPEINRCFVFDSGYRPGNFIYTSCGAIGFTMKIIGKASHSGIAPEKGINSLQVAAKAISRLPLGRIDENSTMNIGNMRSGTAVNVVPASTELEGEVRSFDLAKAEQYLMNAVAVFEEECAAAGAKLEYHYFWDFKPYTIPETAPVFTETVAAIRGTGMEPNPTYSLGGSDANSLNGRGIQSVNLGIGAQNPHSNDEFVLIEDLIKSAEIALELVKKD